MTLRDMLDSVEERFDLPPIELRNCRLAEDDHRQKNRWFAHTWHICSSNIVCVCRDLESLPDEHKFGILLHEIGHLLTGPQAPERAADQAVLEDLGVWIRYRDLSRDARKVQWVDIDELAGPVRRR